MRVLFKSFDSKMASREKLFKAASDFASQIGRDRLLTLTHSEDRDNIVITIWYWGDEEVKPGKAVGTFKAPVGKPASGRPGNKDDDDREITETQHAPPGHLPM